MLKFLGYLVGLVAAFVIVVLILASTKPSSYSVQRSAEIAATPEAIEPVVNDFHNWAQWSPWEKLDPNAKKDFSGADFGTGAVYEWSGNSKAGQGRMEILSATPTETRMQLNFIKPFKSENLTTFTFTPTGNGTHVVWTMSGPMPFMSKVMAVFTSMDKMIGPDLERGLANIKALTEKH